MGKIYKVSDFQKDMTPESNDIPEMDLKYSPKNNIIPQNNSEEQKKMDKTKKELDKIKNWIVKKYKFTQALGVIPPQMMKVFIEEEEVPKETEKFIQLYMIIPEKNFKEIKKIKAEIVKYVDSLNIEEKIWLQIKTPVDIWENCMDGRFELTQGISMAYPLYDTGFLGLLRLTEIHKSLVLQKFEKYVVSYVVGGSFVRGDATKTSDADIFVVINDTDVKRMPRLELKERLRGIIAGQHLQEAIALSGVKNTLHIQTYLLTDFWENVKDANPVIFTFIRDGVPIYDRGTFMPWKTLLKMGKLKPSPESIDMFMKSAEKTMEYIDRRLIDAMIDIYYGVLNPSQALLMLYGVPPPTHKETPKLMDEIFVQKEKMLNKTELKVLEKSVKLFKKYEHNPKMIVSGKEIDELKTESDKYFKRLKELRKQIEKRTQEKSLEELNEEILDLLRVILGKKSQDKIIEDFERELVKTGKFPKEDLKFLKEIISIKKDFKNKKKKTETHKIENAKKNARILINDLIEYNQRCDLASMEKTRMKIKYKKEGKENFLDMIVTNKECFLIDGKDVKKVSNKIEDSNVEEVSKELEKQKGNIEIQINPKIFEILKEEFGNFEIIF